jgi:hypothetical protein
MYEGIARGRPVVVDQNAWGGRGHDEVGSESSSKRARGPEGSSMEAPASGHAAGPALLGGPLDDLVDHVDPAAGHEEPVGEAALRAALATTTEQRDRWAFEKGQVELQLGELQTQMANETKAHETKLADLSREVRSQQENATANAEECKRLALEAKRAHTERDALRQEMDQIRAAVAAAPALPVVAVGVAAGPIPVAAYAHRLRDELVREPSFDAHILMYTILSNSRSQYVRYHAARKYDPAVRFTRGVSGTVLREAMRVFSRTLDHPPQETQLRIWRQDFLGILMCHDQELYGSMFQPTGATKLGECKLKSPCGARLQVTGTIVEPHVARHAPHDRFLAATMSLWTMKGKLDRANCVDTYRPICVQPGLRLTRGSLCSPCDALFKKAVTTLSGTQFNKAKRRGRAGAAVAADGHEDEGEQKDEMPVGLEEEEVEEKDDRRKALEALWVSGDPRVFAYVALALASYGHYTTKDAQYHIDRVTEAMVADLTLVDPAPGGDVFRPTHRKQPLDTEGLDTAARTRVIGGAVMNRFDASDQNPMMLITKLSNPDKSGYIPGGKVWDVAKDDMDRFPLPANVRDDVFVAAAPGVEVLELLDVMPGNQ